MDYEVEGDDLRDRPKRNWQEVCEADVRNIERKIFWFTGN